MGYALNSSDQFSNQSNAVLADDPLFAYRISAEFLYFLFGLTGTVTNITILIAIVRWKKFRKDTVLLTGLTIASLEVSIGYLLSSTRRSIIELTYDFPMTTGQCLAQGIHIFFFETGVLSLCFHLLLISIDRAGIVTLYFWSRIFKPSLVVKITVLINVATVSDFLIITALRLTQIREPMTMSAKCYHDDVVGSRHFAYHLHTTLVVSFMIVFVYVMAVIIMWLKRYSFSVEQQARSQREEAVTRRVSVLIVPIFLLHIMPFTFYAVLDQTSPYFQVLAIYIWMLGCFNSTLNNFVYVWLHPELRKVLNKMVFCLARRRIRVDSLLPTVAIPADYKARRCAASGVGPRQVQAWSNQFHNYHSQVCTVSQHERI